MNYEIDGKQYEIVIVKKNNKNTYVRVKEDLKIYVTTSYFVSKRQIITLLDNHITDLRKMISKQEKVKEKQEEFYYLGKKYDIIIVPTFKNIEIDNNRIYTPNERTLDNWLKKNTAILFQTRLDLIYPKFIENIPYPNLKIRKMTTRWGVCNRVKKNITLNSELMKYGIDQIDYVIIHELSHFVHFDHSKEFWKTVEQYCPNYKKIRKSLKEG